MLFFPPSEEQGFFFLYTRHPLNCLVSLYRPSVVSRFHVIFAHLLRKFLVYPTDERVSDDKLKVCPLLCWARQVYAESFKKRRPSFQPNKFRSLTFWCCCRYSNGKEGRSIDDGSFITNQPKPMPRLIPFSDQEAIELFKQR